jgi:hypothetical protein
MARLATGTPPKGTMKRIASTNVCAAGRPMTRHLPVGATTAASACTPANNAAATR